MSDPTPLLNLITDWVHSRPDIEALILLGSQARGNPQPDSDIDLIFLCDEPSYYRGRDEWLHQFGELRDIQDELWGVVLTRRTFYRDGSEVEFNIATPSWAALPLDAGTRQVLEGGYHILFDRSGRLELRLDQALNKG